MPKRRVYLSGQKWENTGPKTVKFWNFAHKYAPQGRLVCTLFAHPSVIYLSNASKHTFGTEKLEWSGYPMVKIFFKDMFIPFDRIHKRDGRTDTARAAIA